MGRRHQDGNGELMPGSKVKFAELAGMAAALQQKNPIKALKL
jgi:hypothetical protein